MSGPTIRIGGRTIRAGHPPYVIAELSANHAGDLARAIAIVRAAKEFGADAVKLQTYTAAGMTLPIDRPPFVIGAGSPWAGRQLYDLYEEAALPLEWHAPLFAEAARLGIDCLSTPFDLAAIDLLEPFNPVAHKIASFELVDLDLIAAAARTGRPLLMSTGMATAEEIDEAVVTAHDAGATDVLLLRCNSGYPAPSSEMDLGTIPDMIERWDVPVGFSDHTLGPAAAVAAVALGASLIEKHLTISRADPTPDSAFSMEPAELRELVNLTHIGAEAVGSIRYGPTPAEQPSIVLRRSLWWVADRPSGATVTEADVRALRPGGGAAPKHRGAIVGRSLRHDVSVGQPVRLDDVE